jgi:hypothetical protein
MKFKSIFLALFILIVSCENNNDPIINPNNLLLGNWSNAVYDGENIIFERVANLPDEAYGVSFNNEDIYIERSSGFCGTPPLSYFNTEGTWKAPETTLIAVTLQSFPGSFNWRILSLNEEKLVVKRELSEQEIDHRNLMTLFNEIETLAYSVSCTNLDDWTFTAYGSKACGGPQGFIPYSTQIDTVAFLQMVANYTEAEHQYNIRWSIISTCDLPNQPISIECQNGFPILKY